MAQDKVTLSRVIYGANSYPKVIDTTFRELITPDETQEELELSVDDFFQQYERLFFDIPLSGSINSHTYMIERSTQYLGGSVEDEEKRALIEEINSLRQQLLELGQTYLTISNIT